MTEPTDGPAPEQENLEPAAEEQPAEAPAEPSAPTAEQQLAERTLDLQRLQAEYVNYKRRVDRDRELVRAQGEAAVLQSLLTVLDDIARADEHGELTGGFKAVADSLQQAVTKHQLEAFGAKGDAFDPSLHEAVFHAGESTEVEVTSVDTVMRTGYRHGERVLRPATVGVVDPASSAGPVDEAEVDVEVPDDASSLTGDETDEK
ncbi:nucleotide exchange factor GrpE [Aeromicrobium endophyticum]|uniref:Protein GrpE n=1 Tax=Aeromicrobium endophyticum TaxID=2292704 RepID=A0A371PBT7_9ACTN|nr:nucleotide exchange factor GrpE [Aeromicrobium endophyticum]REK73383.1 nucleotide exchange factor GrpE [Aeromicrobium endophyticum]